MSSAITPQPLGQCQATRAFMKARCDAPTDYGTGSFQQSRWQLSGRRSPCPPTLTAPRGLQEVLWP
jgi:hypothetical protein